VNGSAPRASRGVRLTGSVAVAIFLGMVARFWHPVFGFTAFLQLDAASDAIKIPALRAVPVYVYRNTGPYDGLYYAQIAYDPLLRSAELAPAIDNLPYRARRILPAALAWLAAGGRPAGIVHAYAAINLAAWLLLAVLLWRLLPVTDAPSAAGWIGVLFSAGALTSVRFALTDLVALTVLAGALLAAERKRGGLALGLLAAAGLARETSLLALPAICTRPWLSRANLRRAVLAVAPLAAWLHYVRGRAGAGDPGWANFTWPLAGWWDKWRAGFAAVRHLPDPLLAWTTLLATAGLTVQAAYFLVRPRRSERAWRLGAAYVALLAMLGAPVWADFPGAVFRAVLPLTLAFNLLAVRRRASWGWLLAGNLGVCAGLLALDRVPFDNGEIAAFRADGTAGLVREGPGWYGAEHDGHRLWAWSAGRSALEFETWPHGSRTLDLEFSLRSLAPRLVTIRQQGREIWHGAVGAQRTPARIAVAVQAGRAEIDFSTPAPGTAESADPGARTLAFALYDPKVTLVHDGAAAP
jgi:hypothetical protein